MEKVQFTDEDLKRFFEISKEEIWTSISLFDRRSAAYYLGQGVPEELSIAWYKDILALDIAIAASLKNSHWNTPNFQAYRMNCWSELRDSCKESDPKESSRCDAIAHLLYLSIYEEKPKDRLSIEERFEANLNGHT